MTVMDMLDELQKKAHRDEALRERILQTKDAKDPLKAFCAECQAAGYEIYPMDVINVGEEFYASMRRSTNGGGANPPPPDFYELFLSGIQETN